MYALAWSFYCQITTAGPKKAKNLFRGHIFHTTVFPSVASNFTWLMPSNYKFVFMLSSHLVYVLMTSSQVTLLTLNVQGPSYLGLTRSISWLLMPWLLMSPGHQQPWYWLYRIWRSFSYLRKDFKYLCHMHNVPDWTCATWSNMSHSIFCSANYLFDFALPNQWDMPHGDLYWDYTDSKVLGANVGPTWGQQDPGGPHVGHTNLVMSSLNIVN